MIYDAPISLSLSLQSLLQNCWLSTENFEYVLNLYGLNTEEGMGEVLKVSAGIEISLI